LLKYTMIWRMFFLFSFTYTRD